MTSGTAPPPAPDRWRPREREIADATRALFDARGVRDAPMDEIARAAGLNRAVIYRYFESKDDLFVVTVTRYLDELTERGRRRVDPAARPVEQLRQCWGNFADYCLEFPAFLDCALALMRRPAEELRLGVSERTWFRLGVAMADCLSVTIEVLRRGAAEGAFTVEDPAFTANLLYAQTLGAMHLARTGIGLDRAAGGVPQQFAMEPRRVRDACVEAALHAVGASSAPDPPTVR